MAASEMEAVPNGGVPKWGPDEKLIIDKQKSRGPDEKLKIDKQTKIKD